MSTKHFCDHCKEEMNWTDINDMTVETRYLRYHGFVMMVKVTREMQGSIIPIPADAVIVGDRREQLGGPSMLCPKCRELVETEGVLCDALGVIMRKG